ncbi:MAG TPA: M1 family aminopeptidase [Hymenobacter sp.]
MFFHTLRFELRYRFAQPSTYLYFGVFALFAFLSQTVDDFGFNSSPKVHVNSPDALANLYFISSIFGMFITAALLGTPVYRDDKEQMTGLIYTTPLPKWSYLGGRFVGSLLAMWFITSGTTVGALLGMMAPWVEASKLGPVPGLGLLAPLLAAGWVNALFAGSLFFAAYLLLRSPLVVYLGGIVLFVGYMLSQQFSDRVSSDHLFAMLDPFGFMAKNMDAKYWTIAERNTRVANYLGGYLLENRLLWGGIGLAVLLGACAAFRLALPRTRAGKAAAEEAPAAAGVGLRRTVPTFGRGLSRWQVGRLVRVQALNVLRAWPFRVLALLGTVYVLFNFYWTYHDPMRGTSLPVTYQVLGLVNENFTIYLLIIITIYAGELVWRERDTRLQGVFDALPFATWVPFVSKLLALLLVAGALTAVQLLVGMAVQAYLDASLIEPLLYLKNFVLQLAIVAVLCTLALVVQTVVNQKYVGHALMMVYYAVVFLLANALGLHHALLKFGAAVPYTYSDMNGYGHMVAPLLFINLYYLAGAALLGLLASLLWVRGNDTGARTRLRLAAQRLRAPGLQPALALAALAVLATGGWVFYNANVVNEFLTPRGLEARQARTERLYKRFENLAQPKIVALDLQADLFPSARPRGYRLRGRYTLLNETARPLDSLFVNYDPSRSIRATLTPGGRPARVLLDDPVAGIRLYRLAQALAPGDSLALAYEENYSARGFTSRVAGTGVFDWATISPEDRLTENGTFLDVSSLRIGYQPNAELSDDEPRHRQGLAPKAAALPQTDPRGRQRAQFARDADRVRYSATLSTDPDQVAATAGTLEKEWTQGGRRYFRYRMDQTIWPIVSILSARYQTLRTSWQNPAGGPPVAIEIYYDPHHATNVRRMAQALHDGLGYYSQAFGSYQYRHVRLLEFPRYKSFAQSYANTIQFSESAGFIRDLRDRNAPDMTYFITSHELGHQWWGHQIVGADVQGADMLVESLAEYSAIMNAKHEFTPNQMQQFMRGELDQYLRGRRDERKKERPLLRCESQPYIHYYKGGMVFYALQDYIGEDKLNGALRAFLAANHQAKPPYATSADLLGYIRRVTPDSLQYVLHDMFETITLYKNELKEAHYTPRPDGRYDVALTIKAEKVRADSVGNETPVPLADYVEVGIFGPDQAPGESWDVRGKALLVRKVKLTKPETTLRFVVNEKPAKGGIDPYQKLIDRFYYDNVKPLEEQKPPAKAVAAR